MRSAFWRVTTCTHTRIELRERQRDNTLYVLKEKGFTWLPRRNNFAGVDVELATGRTQVKVRGWYKYMYIYSRIHITVIYNSKSVSENENERRDTNERCIEKDDHYHSSVHFVVLRVLGLVHQRVCSTYMYIHIYCASEKDHCKMQKSTYMNCIEV